MLSSHPNDLHERVVTALEKLHTHVLQYKPKSQIIMIFIGELTTTVGAPYAKGGESVPGRVADWPSVLVGPSRTLLHIIGVAAQTFRGRGEGE